MTGYLTKGEAKAALLSCRGAAADGYQHRAERRLYGCHCRQYHLTSQPHTRFDAA